MIDGSEGDEIVVGVGLNYEILRGLQSNRRPEIAEWEGDRAPVVDIARVSQEPDAGVGPVLDWALRSAAAARDVAGLGSHRRWGEHFSGWVTAVGWDWGEFV